MKPTTYTLILPGAAVELIRDALGTVGQQSAPGQRIACQAIARDIAHQRDAQQDGAFAQSPVVSRETLTGATEKTGPLVEADLAKVERAVAGHWPDIRLPPAHGGYPTHDVLSDRDGAVPHRPNR